MTIAKNKIKNKSNLKSQEPLFELLNVFNGEMETNPPTTLTMKLLLKNKKTFKNSLQTEKSNYFNNNIKSDRIREHLIYGILILTSSFGGVI